MKLTWTKLTPSSDLESAAVYPLARSSHGLSILRHPLRLFLYGGEHFARTPIASHQAAWQLSLSESDKDAFVWKPIDCRDGPSERIAHAQAVDPTNNRVYIFGGRAGVHMNEQAMNDLWCYDADQDTWTEVKTSPDYKPPSARSFHRMLCIDQALYVFGGCGADGRLNDLHKFDLQSHTWTSLPAASLLRGRGGANLLALDRASKLGVLAGFAGQETNDGQLFDVASQTWSESLIESESENNNAATTSMRPRSVCVSASFPSAECAVIFGGEVDPSDRGHEGAGGFANDVCILKETSGEYIQSVAAASTCTQEWPEERGWASADFMDLGNGQGQLYMFGGLSGDDVAPRRLDDLWRLDIQVEQE
jgi:hypothetical protein